MKRPSYIPRTEEIEFHKATALRNCTGAFYATEKIDGFSVSAWNDAGKLGFSNRDRILAADEKSVYAEVFDLIPPTIPKGYFVQGEFFGEGIRGNKLGISGRHFAVFNVGKIGGGFLDFAELQKFCREYNFQMVPWIGTFDFSEIESSKSLCEGPSALNPNRQKEGAVFRPIKEEKMDFLGRVSFKIFNPKYDHA